MIDPVLASFQIAPPIGRYSYRCRRPDYCRNKILHTHPRRHHPQRKEWYTLQYAFVAVAVLSNVAERSTLCPPPYLTDPVAPFRLEAFEELPVVLAVFGSYSHSIIEPSVQ